MSGRDVVTVEVALIRCFSELICIEFNDREILLPLAGVECDVDLALAAPGELVEIRIEQKLAYNKGVI